MAEEDIPPKRRLRVFLCHSSGDKQVVRQLYERLKSDGFDPWLDEEKLLPAQRWADVIEDAVRASDVVLVCLSTGSVSKEGFLQREIKFALQVADEKPEETIYIVPTRLEPVDLPRRFREYQAADLYKPDGYERLKQSLAERAEQIAVAPPRQSTSPLVLGTLKADHQPFNQAGRFKETIRRLLGIHSRLVGLGLVVFLGAASFAGYILYRQRVLATQLYSEGIANWQTLKYRKAQDLLSQAAAAGWGDPRILAAYALSLIERGNDNEARNVASRARAFNFPFSSHERHFVDAVYHEAWGEWLLAQQLYSGLSRSGQDVEATIRLAHVQTLGGVPKQALITLDQIPERASHDPRVILERAMAQMVLGHFEDEARTVQALVDEYKDNDVVRATALAERCWAEYNNRDNSGMLAAALADCRQAEKIFIDNEDSLGQARAMTREASILADPRNSSPDFSSALELQNRAVTITHERGAARDEAGSLQNLANILMQKSPPSPEAARAAYDQSESIFDGLHDMAGMAGVENDASVRQMEICSYQEALDNAKKARNNFNSVGSANESAALSNVATMQFFLGDVRQSEANMKTALLEARGNLNIDTSNWLITLGEIYFAEGKFAMAEECFKAGPCYDDHESPSIRSDKLLPDAVLDYATMQTEKGQFKEAESLAQSVLKEAKDDPDTSLEARDVLANALLGEGSDAALNRARSFLDVGPVTPSDCRVGVALHLTAARIAGRSGDLDRKRQELRQAQKSAQDLGLLGYVLEARLEQAALDLRSGQTALAVQEANQVLNEAKDRGLLVLTSRASNLVRQASKRPAAVPFPAAPSRTTSAASQPQPSPTPVTPSSKAETQSSTPLIELSVNRVLVPVVVHDKHGRAVGDLKKEDFQVLDEGKHRPIAAFTVEKRG